MSKNPNKESTVHHSKAAAEAFLFRKIVLDDNKSSMKEVEVKEREIEHKNKKMSILSYAFDDTKEIDDSIVEKLEKTMFILANAYPYLFDAVCGLLTNQKELSRKYNRNIVNLMDIEEAIFFMIDIPFEEFLDWALDGNTIQKDNLIQDLTKLATAPPKELLKYIPISPKYCAKVAPIQIILFRKNEEGISEGKLKRLKNLMIRKTNKGTPSEEIITLSERLPVERIQILPLKLLFQDLMIGEYGHNWFEIPKAFQAKIVDFRPKYIEELSIKLEKLAKELEETQSDEKKEEYEKLEKTIKSFPSPQVLRRTFFYLELHSSSNKFARKINIIATDFFSHVDPSYLKKNNYGKLYPVGGIKGCSTFLEIIDDFFLAFRAKYPFRSNYLKHQLIGKTS